MRPELALDLRDGGVRRRPSRRRRPRPRRTPSGPARGRRPRPRAPLARQPLGRRRADAARAAGDERHPAGKVVSFVTRLYPSAYSKLLRHGASTRSRDYPLGSRRPDLVRTPSGLGLDELTLDAVRAGDSSARKTSARRPRRCAGRRRSRSRAGRTQLADNLARAAELAARAERDDPRDLHRAAAAPLDRGGARSVGGAAGDASSRRRCRRVRPRGGRRVRRRAGCWRPMTARRSERFVSREQRELRRELLISPVPGARARRDGRARTTRSRASCRGRARRRAGRAARRATST